jgi:hypothetical protein
LNYQNIKSIKRTLKEVNNNCKLKHKRKNSYLEGIIIIFRLKESADNTKMPKKILNSTWFITINLDQSNTVLIMISSWFMLHTFMGTAILTRLNKWSKLNHSSDSILSSSNALSIFDFPGLVLKANFTRECNLS